jgi:hypothetical protein
LAILLCDICREHPADFFGATAQVFSLCSFHFRFEDGSWPVADRAVFKELDLVAGDDEAGVAGRDAVEEREAAPFVIADRWGRRGPS